MGTAVRPVPRIRTIKPETFDDPDLYALTPLARWLFIGLWTQADREGRLEDDPRRVKTRLLGGDNVEPNTLLDQLSPKFITRYSVNGSKFIQVNNFVKHQRPHPKEPASVIPAWTKRNGRTCKKTASKVDPGSLILDPGSLVLDPGSQSSADADYEAFRDAYPVSRRVGGKAVKSAFLTALKACDLPMMLAALEQHKRSEQWQTPKLIPLMTTWLNQQRWLQVLPEPGQDGPLPLSKLTTKLAAAGAAFLASRRQGAHDA